MSPCKSAISDAIATIQARLRSYETRYQRPANSVALLAVSKTKPVSDVREAIASGHRSFGENYVDEAVEKIKAIKSDPRFAAQSSESQSADSGSTRPPLEPLQWHFIGQIQSRKSRTIAEHFDWAQSVDRLKVATRLSEARLGLSNVTGPLNICLQVNTDNEPSKAGVGYEALDELADAAAQMPGLVLRGLMAIPAPRESFEAQRAAFAKLKQSFDRLQERHQDMDTLSIGMSGDMEAAVAEGATIVRVGTAIFGARAR